MLDSKYIRDNLEAIKANTANRLADVDFDSLVGLDEQRRELIQKIDGLRSELNAGSRTKPTPEQIAKFKTLGEDISNLEKSLTPIEDELHQLLLKIPNLTHPDVVVSNDEDANPVLESHGAPTKFSFEPKDHVELATVLDLIDFDRAIKVSGAKFYYLKNELVILEQALIRYALDIVAKRGFTLMTTPDLAKREVLEGLGFSPRGESTQVYNIENSDLSLIGTAEITLGGYHQNELLDESELPKKYAALSHCFRTEAGAYSKFSKGIFRVHQFTKVEMFAYSTPEMSEKLHQELLVIEKEIFTGLEVPFRVIDHCTADLGAPSYRTYDIEAWLPGKPNHADSLGDWAEMTSTSNCTDYQARALNIKYKAADGSKNLVYTLNGTAVALTRAMIAIIENHQQADGSITIPKALQSYCGFKKIALEKSNQGGGWGKFFGF